MMGDEHHFSDQSADEEEHEVIALAVEHLFGQMDLHGLYKDEDDLRTCRAVVERNLGNLNDVFEFFAGTFAGAANTMNQARQNKTHTKR